MGKRLMGICEGRVVVITGGGRGLGRAHALEFARQGAKVVVNDLGSAADGSGRSASPADDVVAEIGELGGEAIPDYHDVSDWAGAGELIQAAVGSFGKLDVLVNNAGILRDRTLANMTEAEWDSVVRVHLKGTAATTRAASVHWRERSKAGEEVNGRLVNTTSSSGLYATAGQANYAAAKAGIAALTIVASRELARYGVTANAVYPTAVSRLTEDLFRSRGLIDEDGGLHGEAAILDPANVSPVVAWLGSVESSEITGRIFGVRGYRITVAEGWHMGPEETSEGTWTADKVGEAMLGLHRAAVPNAGSNGRVPS
jgi:NAD(P)-dependent dehydrogenase (short-subunit alcohol dehydrogenase family)